MGGRPGKPVQLIVLEGKSHRTKEEMKHREKAEKSLYSGFGFKESKAVREDKTAHGEFLRLKKLYSKIEYIDGLDEQSINRYCLALSQEQSLQKLIAKMDEDIENCEEFTDRLALYKTTANATQRLIRVRNMLIKLEDRMFLNPSSRIKSIPKTPPRKKEKSAMGKFLERKSRDAQ